MNQRIRELAKHASKLVRIEHPELSNGITMKEMSKLKVKTFLLTEYDVEKFAELIVADCLKQIQDRMVDKSELLYEHEETTECVNEALMDAHHNIAIHFGFAELFGVKE